MILFYHASPRKLSDAKNINLKLFNNLIHILFDILDGKDDPTNVTLATNRSGLLYFLAVSVFMESVNPCVLTFPVDKAIFLREENAKLYG